MKQIPLHTSPAGPIGAKKTLEPHVLAHKAPDAKKQVLPHTASYPSEGSVKKELKIHTRPYTPKGPEKKKLVPHTRVYVSDQPAPKKTVMPHTKAYTAPETKKAEGTVFELLPAYQFRVSILVGGNDFLKAGFSKMSGIESSIRVTAVQEGGVNDRVHLLPDGGSSEGRLTLESGVVYSKDGETTAEKMERYLRPGRRIGYMVIDVLNSGGENSRLCVIEDAIVQRWSLRDFDAMSSQIQLNQFEISYGRLQFA